MRLEGNSIINIPRQKAFKYFTDANFVGKCAPGLERMEEIEPGKKYKAVVTIAFGAVKTTFNSDIEFVLMESPDRAKIKGMGKAPGSGVTATADITFADTTSPDAPNGATALKWVADVTVTGSIASVANRLMAPVTQSLSGKFFDCMKSAIEAEEQVARAAAPPEKKGFLARVAASVRGFLQRLLGGKKGDDAK